jgi:transposase InsO family protein
MVQQVLSPGVQDREEADLGAQVLLWSAITRSRQQKSLRRLWHHEFVIALLQMIARLIADALALGALACRPQLATSAENLVLRRQLALFKERGITPRRIDAAARISLAVLSRMCDWRSCVTLVRPETVVRWHRAGWRLLWRYKSRPGRPCIPAELRQLIRRMATANPTWGQERIANELLLKLGLRVSPRTVRKYMRKPVPGRPRGDQRWATFLRNHAQAIVACDFLVAVTATFRQVYVFVAMLHGSRRLLHLNVTSHPTAAWALQQLREVIGFDDAYHYLLHDRDSIFAKSLDLSIEALGLRVLKSPPHSPKANAICERLIGTIRRECLDWHIPISEKHLRRILISWVDHYNHGRPHMSLGPGLPDPPTHSVTPFPTSRHRVGAPLRVGVKSMLGGLHHEYALLAATT